MTWFSDQGLPALRQFQALSEGQVWLFLIRKPDGICAWQVHRQGKSFAGVKGDSEPVLSDCASGLMKDLTEQQTLRPGDLVFLVHSGFTPDFLPVPAGEKPGPGLPLLLAGEPYLLPVNSGENDSLSFPGIQTGGVIPLGWFCWKKLSAELEIRPASVWVGPGSLFLGSRPAYSDMPQFDLLPLDSAGIDDSREEITQEINRQRWLDSLVQDGEDLPDLNWVQDALASPTAWFRFTGGAERQLFTQATHSQLAIRQFKSGLLAGGGAAVLFLSGLFMWSNFAAAGADAALDWQEANRAAITEVRKLESQTANRAHWYGQDPVPGFRLQDVLLFGQGLTDQVRIDQIQLKTGTPPVSRVIGFSDSETDVARYVSALTAHPSIHSASLTRMGPVSVKNDQEVKRAGHFRLIFQIELETGP